MNYIKEVDGLRAIAVVSVVLFHLNFPFFQGGFIGVDIFFVISGFLITSIILHDLQNNKFSFQNFYLRRIRRIFPVLFLVLNKTLRLFNCDTMSSFLSILLDNRIWCRRKSNGSLFKINEIASTLFRYEGKT